MRFTTAGAVLALVVLAGAVSVAAQTGPGPQDQQFVNQAVRANNQEIVRAQAELQATTDQNVKLFAQTVIKDHTDANTQLIAIATGFNLSYPQPSASDDATPAPSARDYMSLQVQAHEQAVGLYEGEIHNGDSAELRTYAATTLPAIEAHLAMARQYLATGTVSPEHTPAPPGS